MRIQHNIMAMNAYRNYNNNTSALSKNLEKLSSGYKINRAGDDAAGLAISEKMRAQITGLEQAQDNAKSGKNLVQTAEGALQEVHDMLNRMVKLADQSANGTYDNEIDRTALQNEIAELKDEIDRIADSANYNGINLLDGSMSSGGALTTLPVTATAGEAALSEIAPEFTVDLNGLTFKNTGTSAATISFTLQVAGATITLNAGSVAAGSTVDGTAFTSVTATTASISGKNYTVSVADGKLTFTFQAGQTVAASNVLKGGTVAAGAATGFDVVDNGLNKGIQIVEGGRVASAGKPASIDFDVKNLTWGDGAVIEIGGEKYTVDYSKDGVDGTTIGVKDLLEADGKTFKADAMDAIANRITEAAKNNKNFIVGNNGTNITLTVKPGYDDTKIDITDKASLEEQVRFSNGGDPTKGLILQIGDTSDSWNQVRLSIDDIHVDSLGISGIDISSQTGAQTAIDSIKDAINTVSSIRAKLGATQNRLDHTINNLSVMTENIQDAEATIRDTDVAEEMMAYTKNNILVQSAQAMLAQANQVPQGVLQLLQ